MDLAPKSLGRAEVNGRVLGAFEEIKHPSRKERSGPMKLINED